MQWCHFFQNIEDLFKWLPLSRSRFQMHFSELKCINFQQNVIKCSWDDWQQVYINSNNVLVPAGNMQFVIWYIVELMMDSHIISARHIITLIARLMGPTWGPPDADRTQVGPMLSPWILLSGKLCFVKSHTVYIITARHWNTACSLCVRNYIFANIDWCNGTKPFVQTMDFIFDKVPLNWFHFIKMLFRYSTKYSGKLYFSNINHFRSELGGLFLDFERAV